MKASLLTSGVDGTRRRLIAVAQSHVPSSSEPAWGRVATWKWQGPRAGATYSLGLSLRGGLSALESR
ncbi:hypothetical protein PRBEI_2001837000 [Prionailurus iriomotensis]